MVVYGIYASIPLYAVARHREQVFSVSKITLLFWFGVSMYAVASISSATRHVGEWYLVFGEYLNQYLFEGRLAYSEEWNGFYVMDALVEETIELIGAILFLAYYTKYRAQIIL